MNSVKFYLFKVKKFMISWVAFLYYLVLSGKGFERDGEEEYLAFRGEMWRLRRDILLLSHVFEINLRCSLNYLINFDIEY